MMEKAVLILLAFSGAAFAQPGVSSRKDTADLLCNVPGKCLDVVYDEVEAWYYVDCLAQCQADGGRCGGVTLYSDLGLCVLLESCDSVEVGACRDCTSAESACPLPVCQQPDSFCVGEFVDAVAAGDVGECFDACTDDEDCNFYNYDSNNGGCILNGDCEEISDKEGSVTGELNCPRPGDGSTTTAMPATNSTTPEPTTNSTTPEPFTTMPTTNSTTPEPVNTTPSWYAEQSVILIVGGLDSTGLPTDDVEVLDLSGEGRECAKPDPFPTKIYGHASGLEDGSPLVCGGQDGPNDVLDCFEYVSGEWSQYFRTLDEPHNFVAGVSVRRFSTLDEPFSLVVVIRSNAVIFCA